MYLLYKILILSLLGLTSVKSQCLNELMLQLRSYIESNTYSSEKNLYDFTQYLSQKSGLDRNRVLELNGIFDQQRLDRYSKLKEFEYKFKQCSEPNDIGLYLADFVEKEGASTIARINEIKDLVDKYNNIDVIVDLIEDNVKALEANKNYRLKDITSKLSQYSPQCRIKLKEQLLSYLQSDNKLSIKNLFPFFQYLNQKKNLITSKILELNEKLNKQRSGRYKLQDFADKFQLCRQPNDIGVWLSNFAENEDESTFDINNEIERLAYLINNNTTDPQENLIKLLDKVKDLEANRLHRLHEITDKLSQNI